MAWGKANWSDALALAMRLFILDADDYIFRIAVARYDRMRSDPASCALPQFAAQRVREACLTVEIRDSQPQRVLRATYGMLPFDAKGMLDLEALRVHEDASVRSALKFPVANLPGFQHREDAKFRFLANGGHWKPTAELEDALARAVLGKIRVKSV
jgi:hypothetical protein